eukprot:Lankesteria_metandrocarpae@DN1472_c1_g1_i1.p1
MVHKSSVATEDVRGFVIASHSNFGILLLLSSKSPSAFQLPGGRADKRDFKLCRQRQQDTLTATAIPAGQSTLPADIPALEETVARYTAARELWEETGINLLAGDGLDRLKSVPRATARDYEMLLPLTVQTSKPHDAVGDSSVVQQPESCNISSSGAAACSGYDAKSLAKNSHQGPNKLGHRYFFELELSDEDSLSPQSVECTGGTCGGTGSDSGWGDVGDTTTWRLIDAASATVSTVSTAKVAYFKCPSFTLRLSAEHKDFKFEPNLHVAAAEVQFHSKGHCAAAVRGYSNKVTLENLVA